MFKSDGKQTISKPKEINLIPNDVILREMTQRRIWMWAGILLLLIVFLAGMYGAGQREISHIEGVIADLSLKKLEIEEMVKQVNILQEKRDRLSRKEMVINSLLNKRSISLLFAELEKDMNENVWLTSFNFQDDIASGKGEDSDTWVETGYFIVKNDRSGKNKKSQNEAPSVSTLLRGMAKSNRDLARFLELLSRSDIFSEVNLKYSREGTSRERDRVEFEIETHLKNIYQM
jgi:Tfp pilus assembly protein PilN